jgi:hypothetical protein
MQFEVNGQNYVLHFSPEENQWFLFRSGKDGVERFEVADDAAQPELGGVIIPFGNDDRGTVN